MIKKWLIKKIRNLYTASSKELYEEMHADRMLSFLSPLLAGWTYLPVTDWAAGPQYYAHICNDIIINRKKTVVETGSGISTIILARLIKRNNLGTKIVSIDHDAQWQSIVAQSLEADGIRGGVEFLYSPLIQTKDSLWYDTSYFDFPRNFRIDTVIVDGPKGSSPMARFGAAPYFQQYLSPDCYTIYLHDTDREGEQKILRCWAKILPQASIECHSRYSVFQFGTPYGFSPQSQT